MWMNRWFEQKVRPLLRTEIRYRPLPRTSFELAYRVKWTLAFCATFLLLHVLRQSAPWFHALYDRSGFVPGHWNATGTLLCGLFHTDVFHLLANVLGFFFFVGLMELSLGAGFALSVTALGFFLSNPLTAVLVQQGLQFFSPSTMAAFSKEIDYGASNGIYAVVGAMAALLTQPRVLITPFVFNGVLFAIATSSWLALQHLIALGMGYVACRVWARSGLEKLGDLR